MSASNPNPTPAPGHASPDSPRLRAALWVYKRVLSPLLHGISGILSPVPAGCRFLPTCSEYAYVALERHGILRGLSLATWRLLRCHPFARGGFDPVPPARQASTGIAHPANSNPANSNPPNSNPAARRK